jgi:Ca2+-binding RTX toxin-like protein
MRPRTDEPEDPPEPQEPLPPLPPPPPSGVTKTGTSGNDLLVGTGYADQLYGLAGHDTLYGGAGNDRLYGGIGNDWLDGGTGADVLDGGDGQDTVSYINSLSTSGVLVDLAFDVGAHGDAQGDTYIGIEHIAGSNYGTDLLAGNAGNNVLWGERGHDYLYGRAGDDHLFGGDGYDYLDGGVGADMLDGGAGDDWASYLTSAGVTINLLTGTGTGGEAAGDTLFSIEHVDGSDFADVLIGTAVDNKLIGNFGDDQLFGGAGNDLLDGGEGNDLLRGGAGADRLDGGAGVDTVDYQDSSAGVLVDLANGDGFGGDAEGDTYHSIENAVGSNHVDTLSGNADSNDLNGLGGHDWLSGDAGNDRLYGGDGDDDLVGGAGADRLDGGNGNDWARYYSDSAITVNLATGVGTRGDALGDTYFGVENVFGSGSDDVIIGNAGNNIFDGYSGNDILVGGAGEDRLIALSGHDTLTGDGDGIVAADTFVVGRTWANVNGSATITDFQQGVDKIDLRSGPQPHPPDFGTDGELAWGFIDQDGLHGNALDASDKYFFDTSTHTLYECDFSTGTLLLGDALVTVGADIARLQTSDFLLA